MEGVRVLIVGAGLAGLALARALRQAGVGAELIERQAGWDAGGTGIYLPANGVRALAALGLGDAVAAAAVRIPSQRLLTHRGRLLAEIGMGDVWGDLGTCLALPRASLHRMLRDGVPLRLGRTIRALEQVDRPVRVTFDDGASGEYDLVVGADGLRSTVRRLVVDDRPPVPVGQLSWRFLAPRPAGAATWSAMLGRDATFLTLPIGEESIYCYADVGGTATPSGDPVAVLRERFAGFAAPVPELLDRLAPGGGPRGPDRGGRRRALGTRGGGADRRRRARHVAEHGAGRLAGVRGRAGARRLPPRRGQRRGGRRGARGPQARADGVGPRADASPRPHPRPPAGGAEPRAAVRRPADVPDRLPSAAGAGGGRAAARRQRPWRHRSRRRA
ncbi:MAG TPA: FAD-dependent monooxygenase [Actinomycetes bacterium]